MDDLREKWTIMREAWWKKANKYGPSKQMKQQRQKQMKQQDSKWATVGNLWSVRSDQLNFPNGHLQQMDVRDDIGLKPNLTAEPDTLKENGP